jgi:hypothetical protein
MTLAAEDYADRSDSELLRLIKVKKWEAVQSMLNDNKKKTPDDDEGTTTNLPVVLAKVPDVYDNLPLHAAIGYQAPDELILSLLECFPEATQVHGSDDWIPLHIAAMWGVSATVMEALIRAYPQALDDTGEAGIKGRTPRHFSRRFPHNTALLERSTADWMQLIMDQQQQENE